VTKVSQSGVNDP